MKPFPGVDRRTLLTSIGAAAGMAGLASTGLAAAPPKPRAPAKPAKRPHPELEEASVDQLQGRMESGELTAEKLVQGYLDRIAALDGASAADGVLRRCGPCSRPIPRPWRWRAISTANARRAVRADPCMGFRSS